MKPIDSVMDDVNKNKAMDISKGEKRYNNFMYTILKFECFPLFSSIGFSRQFKGVFYIGIMQS